MSFQSTLTISFKTKIKPVYYADNSLAYEGAPLPKKLAPYADKAVFRQSRRFGSYANSDLFEALLQREVKRLGVPAYLKVGALPDCVTIELGFLATVTINIPDSI
jgi:hypothetical protein